LVSANRYLEHHKEKADEIKRVLSIFGHSADTPGFYCRGAEYNLCVTRWCSNICRSKTPPLESKISEKERRQGGCPKYDWLLMWLYHGSWDAETTFHPELHNVHEDLWPRYPVSPEIAALRRKGEETWIHPPEAEAPEIEGE